MKIASILMMATALIHQPTTSKMQNNTETKKGVKIISITKQSETINVSAEKLWEIIGPGFEHAGEWSTAVDHSVGLGAPALEGATCDERSCDLNAKGFTKIKEKITIYNAQNKELAYDIVEGFPGFVKRANNHWRVVDLGEDMSALEMTITIENKKFMGTLMGGMMKKNINATIPTIFRDLKVYAETGKISKEKQERMAEIEKKSKKAA